ncbi:MAG: hypothetical protein FJ011_03135 [Chloroflexi bacterium]|nr:hypothetical protein [Chloroflexota bacterium]
MYLYLCFDVEDLVHPDSDDIPADIATMLADDGVVASMYVVGEKARLWERRGRWDVITAVAQHDVGLHTDHHSVHPTASEYLADKGWDDGVAEALAQEGPGAADLARLFGQFPSSWATSGSSWAPQIPAATRQMGIPANVYAHVRTGDGGACWYAGQLCYGEYFGIRGGENTYCDDAAFEAALPDLLARVEAAQRSGLACLGLFCAHPTRLRYTTFWDVLNFFRGENTPEAEYKSAPRRSDEEYATALRNLRRMIAAVRALPGVEIISTRELNSRFAGEGGPVAWQSLSGLAEAVLSSEGIAAPYPVEGAGGSVSAAAALDLLTRAVVRLAQGGAPPTALLSRSILGPSELAPELPKSFEMGRRAFVGYCQELAQQIGASSQLPAWLLVDKLPIGPGPLLKACAATFLAWKSSHDGVLVEIAPAPGEPDVAAELAQRGIYDKLPGWPPHRPDLRLDLLAKHTRLQSWSLAPASLRA